MRKIINTVLMAGLLILVVGLLLAFAQTDKPDPEKRPRRMGIDLSKEEMGEFIDIFRVWKIVNDLELDEENGVDSAAFYETSGSTVDDFIIEYSKTLRRLAKL